MRFNRVFLFFLTLIPVVSWAEILLLEKSENGYQAPDFANAKNTLTEIYKEILNKYQFPMLQMHYWAASKDDQKLITKLLEPKENEVPEARLIQYFLDEKYGKGQFLALFVPDTLFQASAIYTIWNDIIQSVKPKVNEDDPRTIAYFSQKFDKELGDKIWDFYKSPPLGLDKLNPDQRRASLFAKTYAPFNERDDIIELYFHAARDLIKVASLESLQQGKYTEALDAVLKKSDERDPKEWLKAISDELIRGNLTSGYFKTLELLNNIFKIGDQRQPLHALVQLESEAAKQAKFLLVRGSGGFGINDDQFLLDLPYREVFGAYQDLVIPNSKSQQRLSKTSGLTSPKKPEYDWTPPLSFTPTSLSFGTSVLAGTFLEMAPKGGARVYDYLHVDSIGYAIPFGIIEYLEDTPLKDAFFVPPLNRIVEVLAKGELFHARSKVSLFHIDKKWEGSVKGYQAGIPPNDLFWADLSLGINAYTAPSKSWPTLAGHIARIIAERALLFHIGKDVKEQDEDKIKKSQKAASAFVKQIDNLSSGILPNEDPDTLSSKVWGDLKIGKLTREKLASIAKLLVTKDPRFYSRDNIFYKIAQDPENSVARTTELIMNSEFTFAISDRLPRTKVHALVIPKGEYISLPHLVAHGKEDELLDLFRSIARVAEAKGLDKTGYRIITNHAQKPGNSTNNDAHQEVPHLHIHVAGGECLGKTAVAQSKLELNKIRTQSNSNINAFQRLFHNTSIYLDKENSAGYKLIKDDDFAKIKDASDNLQSTLDEGMLDYQPKSAYMGAEKDFFPWGAGLSPSEFLAQIQNQRIFEMDLEYSQRLVIYRIPPAFAEGIPVYLGATILNKDGVSVYGSIHDFVKYGTKEHLKAVLYTLTAIASALGIDQTGYRLIANHGQNAWQVPQGVMQIFLVGGRPLGITVTNIIGNRLKSAYNDEAEVDYVDLDKMPHLECPVDPAMARQQAREIREIMSK